MRLYGYEDSAVSPGVGGTGYQPTATFPDGTIYLVDMLARSIFVVSIDEHGSLGQSRLFKTIERGAGYPDALPSILKAICGLTLRRLRKLSLFASGDLVDRVRFPVANIARLHSRDDGVRPTPRSHKC
jgi:hypothetical protein